MRKIVKRPDGHEEAIEGTPEEIREYERIVENDRAPKQKKAPELIKGRGDDPEPDGSVKNLKRLLEEIEERSRKEIARGQRELPSPWPVYPIWIVSCSICQRNPCACNHWWNPMTPTTICGTWNLIGESFATNVRPSPFTFDSTCETEG